MEIKENEKSRILIVDDDPLNVKVLKNILECEGYVTDSASDGLKAIKKAKSGNFRLILLDIIMPHIDGFEVCKRLKQSSPTKDIPIIFITAKDDKKNKIKGYFTMRVGDIKY